MHLICPKCKGDNVAYYGMSLSGMGGGYGGTDQRYTCRDCGYTNSFFIDISNDDAMQDSKHENPQYEGSIWGEIYILILILALISVASLAVNGPSGLKTAVYFFLLTSVPIVLAFYILSGENGGGDVNDDLEQISDQIEKQDAANYYEYPRF